MLLSSFSAGHPLLCMQHTPKNSLFPHGDSLEEKLNFHLQVVINWRSSWLRKGVCVHLSSHSEDHIWCRPCACYLSPCEFTSVTVPLIWRPFVLGILHILPSFCFLFWRVPEEQLCSSGSLKVHWNTVCNFSVRQSTPVSLQQHPRGFHYFHRISQPRTQVKAMLSKTSPCYQLLPSTSQQRQLLASCGQSCLECLPCSKSCHRTTLPWPL